MKRFASHYIYLPNQGFLKQYVIEICEGHITNLFRLTEEAENIQWMPGGVIVLMPERMQICEISFDKPILSGSVSLDVQMLSARIPYFFYPFNFVKMKPIHETRYTLLL